MKSKLRPIQLGAGAKRSVRAQFGALCYRIRKDKVQVLLVTSRRTGRWIIPKGWPMDGVTPHKAALREAWEEGGAKGRAVGETLGIYHYTKTLRGARKKGELPVVVAVFAVKVTSTSSKYPESAQRKRKWLSRKKAAARVAEPELQQIIRTFDPKALAR